MNWEYVNEELEKLNLTSFVKEITNLAHALFKKDELALSEDEQKLLLYLLQCGTYGMEDVRIKNSYNKVAAEGKGMSNTNIIVLFRNSIWYTCS